MVMLHNTYYGSNCNHLKPKLYYSKMIVLLKNSVSAVQSIIYELQEP